MRRSLVAVVVALIAGIVGYAAHSPSSSARHIDTPPAPQGDASRAGTPSGSFAAYIERVVDGDTYIARVGAHRYRVRLIGVDTPETVKPNTPVRCFGPQASTFVHQLLTHATVRAAYEPGGQLDRYRRQLWDIWLTDGRFLAGVLAAGGYARAYPVRPQVRYASLLSGLADDARNARRGLWGPPCNGNSFG